MKLLSTLILPIILVAQINFSGNISPTYLIRISDRTEISLPFRLASLQLSYALGDFELKSNTAIEARWQGTEAEIDIRELFLVWYPKFGEVKLGKMIHTWGAADGNNPTDNINPYDYYYMFLAGADRKIGVLSGSVKAYWNNFNLEGIFVPEHTPNRLPFGEEDFPIQFPFEPDRFAKIIDSEYEIGFRLQSSFGWGDASISYFDGHDKSFSWLRMTDLLIDGNMIVPVFGFRKTNMIGADIVTFINDFMIRSEVGYFNSSSDEYYKIKDGQIDFDPKYTNTDIQVFFDNHTAQELAILNMLYLNPLNKISLTYLQYVIQFEYSGLSDINIGAQFLGTYVTKTSGNTLSPEGIVPITNDNFTPGMGTPFAMIAEKAIIINGSTNILDDRMEISAMSLINLEETGYIIGMNVGYSPIENWEVKLGLSKFIGDDEDPENRFSQMEDFSHLSLGLEFSF